MNRIGVSLGFSAIAAHALGLNGCNTTVSDKAAAPPAGQAADDNHDHAGHEHRAADMEKAKAELAKL